MNEFVIVKFPDRRVVLVDDVPQGYNKDESGEDLIKELETGNRKFALEGENNYTPSEQWVDLEEFNLLEDLRIVTRIKDGHVTTAAGYFRFNRGIRESHRANHNKPVQLEVVVGFRGVAAARPPARSRPVPPAVARLRPEKPVPA